MLNSKVFLTALLLTSLLLTSSPAVSQISAPPPPSPAASPTPYGLTQTLGDLEQTAQNTVRDLQRARVDKWKTDGRTKDQSRSNVESLQRNLTSALPTLVQQVRANPASLAPAVKLYRNLNAVYDVLASVSESAGAFGSKDDFNALARDAGNLDNVRRSIAEQLEQLAGAQDAQLVRLNNQLRAQQQAAAAAVQPPKHVIVDDNPAPKKAPAKKKAVPQPPATANPANP